MVTVEVEDVRHLAQRLDRIVVGRIGGIEQHTSDPKLRVIECGVGGGEVVPVLTNLSGLERGMSVAVALPGALLTDGEGRETEVAAKMFGTVDSQGVLVAPEQIGLDGLFPAGQLINLTEVLNEPGTLLAQAVHFDDFVLEVDNKSLTNRPDLWGHYGIAREIAAIYGLELRDLPTFATPIEPFGLDIAITDPDACRRFTATLLRGVRPVASPLWMRSRLVRVGQRPINLLVDLTNYVMLAVGQPCHAFDAAVLTDPSPCAGYGRRSRSSCSTGPSSVGPHTKRPTRSVS